MLTAIFTTADYRLKTHTQFAWFKKRLPVWKPFLTGNLL